MNTIKDPNSPYRLARDGEEYTQEELQDRSVIKLAYNDYLLPVSMQTIRDFITLRDKPDEHNEVTLYLFSTELAKRLIDVASKNNKEVFSTEEFVSIWRHLLSSLAESIEKIERAEQERLGYTRTPSVLSSFTEPFALGLKREILPTGASDEAIGHTDRKKTTLTYFAVTKGNLNLSLQTVFQLKLGEDPSITEADHYQRQLDVCNRNLQKALGPNGLQLFKALCSERMGDVPISLDINRLLDRLGCKRDGKGRHASNNKNRIYKKIEALTNLEWNLYKVVPKDHKTNTVYQFHGPLVKILGEYQSYDVSATDPEDIKSKKITHGIKLYVEPELFKEMDSRFIKTPEEWYKLDCSTESHKVLLYEYINNQWGIGWNQHKGVLSQRLSTIIDKSGLSLPRKPDRQLEFARGVIQDLEDMKKNPGLFIGSLKIDKSKKPTGRVKEIDRILGYIITVTASEEHPLRQGMKNNLLPENTPPN